MEKNKGVLQMTRKQALNQAIHELSKQNGQEEVIEKLKSICNELPLCNWTEAAIKDSVEQFYVDNGRYPNVTDFKKKCLPPHPSVKRRFGINLKDWLHENYPSEPKPRTNKELTEEQKMTVLNAFKDAYLEIEATSSEDYDKRRPLGAPCWLTAARRMNTSRWLQLVSNLGLPRFYSPRGPRPAPQVHKVNIYTHYDFKE
jgi:hypothetical protein